MRARIERDHLRKALKTVLPAVGKSNLPVLNGVRIDATKAGLTLTCSDLQLTIATDVDAQVQEPGSLVVSARLLAAFVDRAPSGVVELHLDDENVRATAGDSTAVLRTLPIDQWPRVNAAEGDPLALSVEQVERLRCILPFAATDEVKRDYLCGIYVSGDTATATDSYRMGRATLDGADLPEAIIPAAALTAALKGAETVEITVGDRRATIAHGSSTWTTVLLEGSFPQVERLVRPSSPHTLTFNVERLLEAIGRTGVVGGSDREGNRPPLRIMRDGDKAIVRQVAADVGEVDDVVPCSGDFDLELGANPDYLVDLVSAAGTDEVTIGLLDQLKPMQV